MDSKVLTRTDVFFDSEKSIPPLDLEGLVDSAFLLCLSPLEAEKLERSLGARLGFYPNLTVVCEFTDGSPFEDLYLREPDAEFSPKNLVISSLGSQYAYWTLMAYYVQMGEADFFNLHFFSLLPVYKDDGGVSHIFFKSKPNRLPFVRKVNCIGDEDFFGKSGFSRNMEDESINVPFSQVGLDDHTVLNLRKLRSRISLLLDGQIDSVIRSIIDNNNIPEDVYEVIKPALDCGNEELVGYKISREYMLSTGQNVDYEKLERAHLWLGEKVNERFREYEVRKDIIECLKDFSLALKDAYDIALRYYEHHDPTELKVEVTT